MKVANMETKRKKDYTAELYFDVIEEIKKQFGHSIFREKPDLFAQVHALINEDKPKAPPIKPSTPKISLEKKVKIAKEKAKDLPIWTGRRIAISASESQAIKNRILELGRGVEQFTKADAKEACKDIIANTHPIDSVLHSQFLCLVKRGLIKTIGKLTEGGKKINYYALA